MGRPCCCSRPATSWPTGVQRVRAFIRRSYPDHDAVLSVAGLSINPRTRMVQRGSRAIGLTRTEFALREVLMLNVGIVMAGRPSGMHLGL